MRLKSKFLIICFTLLVISMSQVYGQAIIDSSSNKQYFYDDTNKLRMITFRQFGQELMQNFFYDLNGNLTRKSTDWYKDTFERGQFDLTRFTAGYPSNSGNITNNPAKVINGNYAALGEVASTQEWLEFLHTDLNKLRFEPNTTYKVMFNYKVNQLSDRDGYFYFLSRTPDGSYSSFDRGFTSWTGQIGQKGSKTITFTTGPSDNYYLIWGLNKGGSLSIDDIQIKKVQESFESGTYAVVPYTKGYPANAGSITNDAKKVISGSYSVLGEVASTQEWLEFLHTDLNKLRFEPNTTYKVTFKYKINQLSDRNGYFYFLSRTPDGTYSSYDRGFTTWTGQVGEVGSKTITFTTGPSEHYYLIWGLKNGGSLSIDDIQITKEEESFESGGYVIAPYTRGYPANAGSITNDLTKVISGSYSILGEVASTQEWLEFLHTDLNKLRFEPNTTYKVTFKYKINQLSDRNGYFYFLSRTPDGTYSSYDRGFTTWTGQVGEVGSKTITFTTGLSENYYLIWGLNKGGSLSIDDINIQPISM